MGDVIDRVIEAIDNSPRDNSVVKLLRPIVVARWPHARVGALRLGIASHLAAGLDQHFDERAEMGRPSPTVDEQRLNRAAYASAPHLGVEHNPFCHIEIGSSLALSLPHAFVR